MEPTNSARQSSPRVALSRFAGAYHSLLSELRVAEPRVVNVDWPHVHRVVQRALEGAALHRERLMHLTPELDVGRIDALPLYLDAFIYTSARCLPPTPRDERHAWCTEALALRQRMLLDVDALSPRPVRVAARAALSMDTGFANLAGDLLKLSCLLGDLARAGHAGLVSEAERARAEQLALSLVEACDHEAAAARALREAQRERRQAFALLAHAYEELREGLGFLLRREPAQRDHWVPPLARVPGRGEKSRRARMRSR